MVAQKLENPPAAAEAKAPVVDPPLTPDRWVDDNDVLLKLTPADFGRSVEGRKAYCQYQQHKWKLKEDRIDKMNDPKEKIRKRLERDKAKIAKLEEQLKAMG